MQTPCTSLYGSRELPVHHQLSLVVSILPMWIATLYGFLATCTGDVWTTTDKNHNLINLWSERWSTRHILPTKMQKWSRSLQKTTFLFFSSGKPFKSCFGKRMRALHAYIICMSWQGVYTIKINIQKRPTKFRVHQNIKVARIMRISFFGWWYNYNKCHDFVLCMAI